jgi:hypothetical protein
MKKALFLLLFIPFLISCEQEPEATNWSIVNVSIQASDWTEEWTVDANNNITNRFYYCTIAMPEISNFIYTQGLVQAYYTWQNPLHTSDKYQQLLPCVRHYEEIQNNTLFRWTTTTDYTYTPGYLTFYVTNSDFAQITPPAMDFRIVLMW